MYDTLAGRATEDAGRMRITHAKNAVRTFLGSMTQPRDTVGLVSYNTSYTLLTRPSGDKSQVAGFLDGIERPDSEQAYTELYAALTLAVEDFRGFGGRKAIVILSDGENYPYLEHSGNLHPEFGEKIYRYTEPIRACQEAGISVYAVNFAPEVECPALLSVGFLDQVSLPTGVYGAYNLLGGSKEIRALPKAGHEGGGEDFWAYSLSWLAKALDGERT